MDYYNASLGPAEFDPHNDIDYPWCTAHCWSTGRTSVPIHREQHHDCAAPYPGPI